jgi:hypothetical protein
MIKKGLKYIQVLNLLGPSWAFFRLIQAVRAKTGYWEKKTPESRWGRERRVFKGQFPDMRIVGDLSRQVGDIFKGSYCLFSRHKVQAGFVPDWFAGYFAGQDLGTGYAGKAHWSKIPDFASNDIKGVWELSRFAWVYPLIWAWQVQKNDQAAEVFWDLVEDWVAHNPPNTGVHWKCGQEIAIRMFALVSGYASFQDAEATTEDRTELLAEIVFTSGLRIDANIAYALSQKNNHGVSEAAGLFTAGVMLDEKSWVQKGKKLLEQQVRDLIYADGSFSQHSVNYHRVMLQVYLWAIQMGKSNNISFSNVMLERVRKAGQWLFALCDPKTGRCPNLGANDGALIFPVTGCDYLDYRPTIQAVGCVVDGKKWIGSGSWDGLAAFLGAGQAESRTADSPGTAFNVSTALNFYLTHFDAGGYAIFSRSDTRLVFRCPKSFRHRPGQCDLLHVDLFHNGINVLRDAGSYSYNCDPPWQDYFTSNAAHNTIQFDDHDQMPRLSRFLLGNWPTSHVAVDEQDLHVTSGFTDWKGCRHQRTLQANETGFTITDLISGFKEKAVLRWRLAPEFEWSLDGMVCSSSLIDLKISVNDASCTVEMIEGWESLYYHERTALSVLEVRVGKDCREFVTEIEMK